MFYGWFKNPGNKYESIGIRRCVSAGSRLDSNLIIMQNKDDTDFLNIHLLSELQLIKKKGVQEFHAKTHKKLLLKLSIIKDNLF